MGQDSRPWAGRTPSSPGDAGSYTATEWWNTWGPMMRASNALTFPALNDIGVFLASDFGGSDWIAATVYPVGSIVRPTTDNFHAYMATAIAGTGTSAGAEPVWPTYPGAITLDNPGANQITWTCMLPGGLYPYSVAVNSVSIALGVSIIDGNVHESGAIESFVIPNATAGNVRDDRIVIRKTFGAVTQTSRLTLLTGGEVASPGPGTPPVLTQDRTRTTFWDIPVVRVSVTAAGVITITDERVFVDAAIQKFHLPCFTAWDTTGGAYRYRGNEALEGVLFADAVRTDADCSFVVPNRFISSMLYSHIVVPAAGGTGDMYVSRQAFYGACGEAKVVHGAGNMASYTAYPVVSQQRACVNPLQLTAIMVDDEVSMQFRRLGTDALDTVGQDCLFYGWTVEYLGWR